MGNLHIQMILGDLYDDDWEYLLVLPSSVTLKQQQGYSIVKEDASEVQGQSLYLVGRPRPQETLIHVFDRA
jgi:hypothetical protein